MLSAIMTNVVMLKVVALWPQFIFLKFQRRKNVLWRWHQNAGAVVVLASDELLGDEVHAVTQRCDERDVSVTVKGGKVILKCLKFY
jgi:hypothetical protein